MPAIQPQEKMRFSSATLQVIGRLLPSVVALVAAMPLAVCPTATAEVFIFSAYYPRFREEISSRR